MDKYFKHKMEAFMQHSSVIKTICLSVSLFILPLDSIAANTPTAKQVYAQAEVLRLGTDVKSDPAAAFQIMKDLANTGHARAQDKLAYYYLRGIGTAINVKNAEVWYQAAIKNGRKSSRTSYAKLLLKQNAFDEALTQLTLATQAEVRGAATLLAVSHHDGSFGPLSKQVQGTADLTKLAQTGDVRAIQYVLIRLARGDKFDLDSQRLMQDALQISRDPTNRYHAKTAEALLAFLRQKSDKKQQGLRAELLKNPDLRGKIWAAESLYLAVETNPASFWRASEEIVKSTNSNDYARALYLTSRLNKNAYVKILQKELGVLGYKPGRASGYLTSSTIRAITKLCKDIGISNTCRLGPLKSGSIKKIAKWLSDNRQS